MIITPVAGAILMVNGFGIVAVVSVTYNFRFNY